jgi:hypothetical protein
MGWLSPRQGMVLHDTPTIMTFSTPRSDDYEQEHSSNAHFKKSSSSALLTKNSSFGCTQKAAASGPGAATLPWKKKSTVQRAPSRGPIFGSSIQTSGTSTAPSSSTSAGNTPFAGKQKTPSHDALLGSTSPWKKNQPVQHATFGIGIIQLIEEKNSLVTHVTVQFKTGTKKLDARFIKSI